MSVASAYAPFDPEAFLSRVDQATSQQAVLQLLRELEQTCARLDPATCQAFADQVASRLSQRFTQLLIARTTP